MRNFTKEKTDSAVYLINQFLSKTLPFLTLPLVVSVLGAADIGRWSIYLVATTFSKQLLGQCMDTQLIRRYYLASHQEKSEEISGIIIVMGFLSILYTGLLMIVGNKGGIFGIPAASFFLMMPIAFFFGISELTAKILRMDGRSFIASGSELSANMLILALDLLFICILKTGWWGFIYSRLMIYGITFVISGGWLLKRFGLIWRLNPTKIKCSLVLGMPIGIYAVGEILIMMTDRIILERLFSLEAVGVFAVGYMAAGGVNAFNVGVDKAWSPWLLRQLSAAEDNFKIRIARKTHELAVTIVLIGLLMACIGKIYLNWFMTAEFDLAESVLYWMIIAFVFQGFYKSLVQHIVFLGKTNIFIKLMVGIGLLNFILTVWFVSVFGIAGAAQATALAFCLQFLVCLAYIQKKCPLPTLFFIKQMN